MRPAFLRASFAVGLGLLFAVTASAASDPLRLVPDQADFLIEIKQPRKIVEGLSALDLYKQVQTLPQSREFFESTNYRRFLQLLSYYEKELGAPYPELIDKLAGGGIVVAGKFAQEPAPAVMVVQGTDAALMKKFVDLVTQVVEQELARQESKEKITKDEYRKVEVTHVGQNAYAAVVGEALLISNKEKAMQLALDLALDGGGKSMAKLAHVGAAKKLLPADPLATLWVSMEPAHKAPGSDQVFKLPRKEFGILLTIFFGGNVDVAGRAPYVCAGLYQQKDGFLLTTRLPAGRDGSDPAMTAHIPPAGTKIGSRPLLQPKNVLFSTSFYLDLGKFWDDRAKLYGDDQLQAFEAFDEQSSTILVGTKFSKLLASAGTYHRFVAVHQEKSGYTTVPKTSVPAFAFVVEQRDPEVFARTMDAVIRAGALFASQAAGLKLKDEMHGETKIVGYRFDEKFKLPQDTQDVRFNFSPCFFTVGKQWVIASTLELGRELCDLLMKEDKGETTKGSPSSVKSVFYGAGGAELLKSLEDVIVTQAILDQALTPAEAKEQTRAFIEVVRKLGTLTLDSGYNAKTFHYDMRLKLGK